MADQVATFGLDSAEFRRGLGDVEAASTRAAEHVERGWGEVGEKAVNHALKVFGAFKAAHDLAHFAAEAVHEYAGENELAAQALRRADEAGQNLRRTIGRDLVGAWGDMKNAAISAAEGAYGKLKGISDYIAGTIRPYVFEGLVAGGGESLEDLNSATRGAEEQQRENERRERMRRTASEQREAFLRANGQVEEAEREAEERLHEQKMADLRKQNEELRKKTGQGFNDAEARAYQKGEDARHAARLDQIHKEGMDRYIAQQEAIGDADLRDQAEQKRAADAASAAKKAHDDAVFGLQIDDQRARIAALRAAGQDKEAEALKVQLDLAQKLREIEDNKNLTGDEKARFKTHAMAGAQLALAGIAARPDEDLERRHSSGNPVSGLSGVNLAQALGGGGSIERHTKKTAENSDAMKALLVDIKNYVQQLGQGGAVLN